jgi:surfeit locus 1 family protein
MASFLARIKLLPLVIFIAVLVGLLSLGFWQLDRADQKRVYLEQQANMAKSELIAINGSSPDNIDALKFRNVMVMGQYDSEHQFLLDNQHVNGKVGYFVLTPFKIANSSKALLVNRGWLPLNKDRRILPKLPKTLESLQVIGRVNSFPGVGLELAGAEQPSSSWPAVVGIIDREVLAKALGYPLFSFQIELDPAQHEGYLREWHIPVRITPEKHIAYALQWFGLAFALTVCYVWLIFIKST